MSQSRDRRALYAEVLSGLRDLSAEIPADRFDHLVDDLVAAGRLTRDEGAALRFWQRETLRNQADHLVTTASATLSALDEARDATRTSVASADEVWRGRGPSPRHASPATMTDEPSTPLPAETPADAAVPPMGQQSPAGELSAAPAEPERGRHRAADPVPMPAHLDLTLALRPNDPPLAAPPTAPPTTQPTTPPIPTTVASEPEPAPEVETLPDHEPATPSARRRRLLVAGLTVINEAGTNWDDPDASDSVNDPYDDRPAVG